MDTVVVTNLVTGGTAVLSGLLGYLAASGQRTIELRRLGLEEAKLIGVRDDEMVQLRREAYLRLLTEVDAPLHMLGRTSKDLGHEELSAWWTSYNDVERQGELASSDPVRNAANTMYEVWVETMRAMDQRLMARPGLAITDALNAEMDAHKDKFIAARRELVDTMRADLGT